MNSGNDLKKKLATVRKRKMNYVSNVLVVKDPKFPEKEGKVFLFKYGVKNHGQAQRHDCTDVR